MIRTLACLLDGALGDEAAGDGPDLGDLEDLADDGAAEVHLLDLGDEHALDGLLHVVSDLVDDVITTDLDLLLVGQRDGPVLGRDAEADDDRLRGVRQHDVWLFKPSSLASSCTRIDKGNSSGRDSGLPGWTHPGSVHGCSQSLDSVR